MTTDYIGRRLRALREAQGMSQEDMRLVFGFKDRQTVSNLETGTRSMSANELLTVIERLGVSVEYFNDPFQLIGEGDFSWRQEKVSEDSLLETEQKSRRWIAAYRVLASQLGHKKLFLRQALGITKQSNFKEAMMAGEQFVEEFRLGETPALRLIEVMEEDLNILVLMIDASLGVSGAACRLPDLATVLIARGDVEGRRNFNLAHELFHILTWDAMPPRYSESPWEFSNSRAEQLANNFAGALLMPASTLNAYSGWSELKEKDLTSQLNCVADELHVTSTALSWRLVSLGHLQRSVVRNLSESALRNNGHRSSEQVKPSLFSKKYVDVVGRAIEIGNISARRAAGLFDMNLEQLNDLFVDHNLDFRIEL